MYRGRADGKGGRLQMEDTIAAIATAPGEGGIGIVRISGEASRAILEKFFSRVKKEYHKQQSVSREDEKNFFSCRTR